MVLGELAVGEFLEDVAGREQRVRFAIRILAVDLAVLDTNPVLDRKSVV